MTKRTAQVSFETLLRFTPEKRTAFDLDMNELPESVLADILITGARTILTNTYNGGGKDASESDRMAKVNGKWAAWKRGDFLANGGERGDTISTEMRDCFVARQVSNGRTVKQAEASIRDTVTEVFGKEEKATFPRYLDAVATKLAKANKRDYEEVRAELEDAAMAAVGAARKARAEAEAESPVIVDAADLF